MIDTVVLIIEEGKFTVSEPEKFSPTAIWCSHNRSELYGRTFQNYRSVQNPTSKELNKGIYKPRLTLLKGFSKKGVHKTLLKIEVSLPKLLYGNNFDELKENNFQAVIEKLAFVLRQMGLYVGEHDLRYADISTIHYSKNLLLDKNMTSQEIIQEISKGNYSLRQDIENVKYRNAGNLFKIHTNTWEFAVYDKIKDLQQAKISNKRSEENDNQIQLHFLDKIKSMPSIEVLRLEARLNKRKAIRSLLTELNIHTGTLFKDLYSEHISRQVLLHYIHKMKAACPDILNYNSDSNTFSFPEFMNNNPTLTLRDKFLFYGVMTALKTHGMRDIKEMLKDEKSKKSWYRMLKATKQLNIPREINYFVYLENKLKEFNPLSLEQFHENYYNIA